MTQFFATAYKELLLLKRDRSGLLVLFVMPAILVLVITIVQENAMKTMGETPSEILFIDSDGGDVGRRMEKSLSETAGVRLTKVINGRIPDRASAIDAVAAGKFQLGFFIPEGITATVQKNARIAARKALSLDTGEEVASPSAGEVELFFDPTVMGGFRSAVTQLLQLMIFSIEVEEKIAALSELLPEKMKKEMTAALGPMAMEAFPGAGLTLPLKWNAAPLLRLSDASAVKNAAATLPNAVQQNVPAWALFGVFFIVLPMAGSFIKERVYGVRNRLLSLPVSYFTLVAGKVCAYMMVCLVQFALILGIGKWLLPLLGTPAFAMGGSGIAAGMIALSAILAATGYGILLGTLVNSYEQASMFGSLSIVVAAAIGGIMVPVYAMPALMRNLSVLSPLSWAQNAFLEVFVRGGNFHAVLPQVASLLIFALACILSALLLFGRQVR
jgi:ABC-2 type transport system permease protein